MGSKGIKRRKPYRRLPPVGRLPTENDVIPPHIMWPERGSGFEADPFSPAGTAQRSWWALNAVRRRSPLAGAVTTLIAWLFLLYFAYVFISMLVHSFT